MKRFALAALLSLAPLASNAAVTSAQWGVDRTTSPWTVCIYDSTNTCQGVFTLPSSSGGALVPSSHGGTGVNNNPYTITLGGNVSLGSTFSTTGAFTTGGAFSTNGAFATGGALSTAGPFTMSGAFSFTGTLTGNTNVTFPTSGTLLTSATLGVTIGSTTISGGTNGDIEFNNSGVFGEKSVTGSGNVVLATSPILATPNLGTPSAATLTNATGLPISGISGLGTGIATFLATPDSANLAAALTDETGTGSAVFSASPALTGSPTAPTQTSSDNTTKIATDAFVQTAVSGSVTSFNTRTGAVVSTSGDYSTSQLTINGGSSSPICSGGLGALCKLNMPLSGPTGVTFTNSSATINWTANGLSVGNIVFFETTGSLPTNFTANTNYFVVSSTTNSVAVAATYGGSSIVAGSAGSGTQTGFAGPVLSTSTNQIVGEMTIGAGDWNCAGVVAFSPAGSTTIQTLGAAINTSTSLGTPASNNQTILNASFTTGDAQTLNIAPRRFASASPENIVAVADAAFGVSSMFAYGEMECTRED